MKTADISNLAAPVLDHSVYLQEKVWQKRKAKNTKILKAIVTAHRQRRLDGQKHPIIDFLFEYYHFKPSKLLEWSPGLGCYLLGKKAGQFLTKKGFNKNDHGVYVDPKLFPANRTAGLDWTINLLNQTLNNKPRFNCFGLHEWCMIYEHADIRHPQLPLRLSHEQTRKIVEQHQIQCSHYDAYRFYSDTAIGFNQIELNRENMPEYEQPGCLHTNMDLYRWAYKFHPWISSDLITATFLLALEIRETDMRASPYDVSSYSSHPAIAIETTEGKSEYVELQKQFSKRAKPLRTELRDRLVNLREKLN